MGESERPCERFAFEVEIGAGDANHGSRYVGLIDGELGMRIHEQHVPVIQVILEDGAISFAQTLQVKPDHQQIGVGGEAGNALAVSIHIVDG
jgi:hypothetical protein